MPSEKREPRWWRTRQDPFSEDWPAVAEMLAATPGLEAQTVLELLEAKQPGRYNETHLRTLQRRIRRWRAEHGPDREIWFSNADSSKLYSCGAGATSPTRTNMSALSPVSSQGQRGPRYTRG